MPATSEGSRPSPRERLLAAADQLFYEEGISSVGVDRILQRADVARASLYTTYGSKEELVRAYLQQRSANWQAFALDELPRRWQNPRDRIVGVFVLLTNWFEGADYRGCPFINASAEASSAQAVRDVRERHRAWVRDLFSDLARAAGIADPEAMSAQLVLLYDGSMVGAQLDQSSAAGEAAQAAAQALLKAATGT